MATNVTTKLSTIKTFILLLLTICIMGSNPTSCLEVQTRFQNTKIGFVSWPTGSTVPGVWAWDTDCTNPVSDEDCFRDRLVNRSTAELLHVILGYVPWSLIEECDLTDLSICSHPDKDAVQATFDYADTLITQAFTDFPNGAAISITALNTERDAILPDIDLTTYPFADANSAQFKADYLEWVNYWITRPQVLQLGNWYVFNPMIEYSMTIVDHQIDLYNGIIDVLQDVKQNYVDDTSYLVPSIQWDLICITQQITGGPTSKCLQIAADYPSIATDNTLGISTYPNIDAFTDSAIVGPVENTYYNFDIHSFYEFQNIIILESGMQNGFQAQFFKTWARLGFKYKIPLFIYWGLEDFDPYFDSLGSPESLNAFRDIGLFDDSGYPTYKGNDGLFLWDTFYKGLTAPNTLTRQQAVTLFNALKSEGAK